MRKLFIDTSKHSHKANSQGIWLKELRICHPDLTNRYFALSLTEREIQQEDIQTIIESLESPEEFSKAIKSILTKKTTWADDLIKNIKPFIKPEHAKAHLTSIINLSQFNYIRDRNYDKNPYIPDISRSITELTISTLESSKINQESRFEALKNALQYKHQIHTNEIDIHNKLFLLIEIERINIVKKYRSEPLIIDRKNVDKLKFIWCEIVHDILNNQIETLTINSIQTLVYFLKWGKQAIPNDVKLWLEKLRSITKTKDLLNFIKIFYSKYSQEPIKKEIYKFLDYRFYGKYADEIMQYKSITPEEKPILDAFLAQSKKLYEISQNPKTNT